MIAAMFKGKDFIFYTSLFISWWGRWADCMDQVHFGFYFEDRDLNVLLCTELGWFAENLPNYVHVQLFIDLLQLMLTLFRCNNLWVIVQQHKIKNWFVICSGSFEFSISCISIYLYVSTVTTPTLGTTDLNRFPYWKSPNWVFFSLSE